MPRQRRTQPARKVEGAAPVRAMKLVVGATAGPRESQPLRVAVASQDGETLDAHFGFARRLLIYEVGRRWHRLVTALSFDMDDGDSERTVGSKLRALAGCQRLYATAIGPPAAARAIRAGIEPIRVPEAQPIAELLSSISRRLRDQDTPHPPRHPTDEPPQREDIP